MPQQRRQLLQVPDPNPDIGLLVEQLVPYHVGQSQSPGHRLGCPRHELHQSHRADARHGSRIVLAFLTDDRSHEVGIDQAAGVGADRGEIAGRIGHVP